MARAIWSGAISFGLLNIPVEIMSAKEQKRLSFRMLDKTNKSPIGYQQFNKATGHEVQRKNIVKGFEFKKNNYVILQEKDFLKANPKATRTIDIEDFVELNQMDVLFFEKPYYLVPAKNGEKGYELLRKVLEESEKVAIAKVVLHNRQHLVSVMTRGDYLILEVLRFADEVLELDEVDLLDASKMKKVKVTTKELAMAKQLVESMTAKWKPEQYHDTYQDDLKKLIQRKVKSGDTEYSEEIEKAEEDESDAISSSSDLMSLLKKSVATKDSKTTKKASGEKKTPLKATAKKVASKSTTKKAALRTIAKKSPSKHKTLKAADLKKSVHKKRTTEKKLPSKLLKKAKGENRVQA